MRRLKALWMVWVCSLSLAGGAWAGDYKLTQGTVITGEVAGFNEMGVVFRLDTGGFSERTPWSRFTQDSLKELVRDDRLKEFVEPFIEIPPEAKPKPRPIVLKEVPRVERPIERTTFFSSFTTPMGLALLGILYFANLFAAYEVAHYRNRPVGVVCGVSAVLPLVGPLLFLASPSLELPPSEDEAARGLDQLDATAAPAPAVPARGTTSRAVPVGTPKAPAPGAGLRVAAQGKAADSSKAGPKVFNRGDYTFNRRFIETQFSGFFRIVPTEAEKDLVLVVRTPKQQYIGKRISRISGHELFLQLVQGGGTQEVNVGFGEIAQIIVRHKDAKD